MLAETCIQNPNPQDLGHRVDEVFLQPRGGPWIPAGQSQCAENAVAGPYRIKGQEHQPVPMQGLRQGVRFRRLREMLQDDRLASRQLLRKLMFLADEQRYRLLGKPMNHCQRRGAVRRRHQTEKSGFQSVKADDFFERRAQDCVGVERAVDH